MQAIFSQADPTVFRENISKFFSEYFKDEVLGRNVETGIYNYTIQEANVLQIIKKWKNKQFCNIYAGRFRSLLYNFNKNPAFKKQVEEKTICPQSLSNMTHQEMDPAFWSDRIEKKMKRDHSRLSTNIEASTDLFTCKKCRSKKCTYYELQTRSADEPATIFITCLDCGKNWKN